MSKKIIIALVVIIGSLFIIINKQPSNFKELRSATTKTKSANIFSQMRLPSKTNKSMNLNQITVPVLDVEKSIGFYEKLGLKLIVKNLPDYARFECPEGESTFSLHRVEKLPQGEGIWVYFETNNLDERVQELLSQGIIFEELPNDKPWLWREARLKDLDNNQLILFFAGTNRLNPPWRIKE